MKTTVYLSRKLLNQLKVKETESKDRCFIATGYALSEDGLWRCHSWVVQPMARTVRVWETTVKRVAYFGVVLTSEECEDFVENNT